MKKRACSLILALAMILSLFPIYAMAEDRSSWDLLDAGATTASPFSTSIGAIGGTVELDKSQIENEAKFLKEGLEVLIFFYESEMLGIELPEKITYTITKTEPAIKGNTATNATKDAEIETGMNIRVPLFIDEGEEVIVSTKDGKYVSRA